MMVNQKGSWFNVIARPSITLLDYIIIINVQTSKHWVCSELLVVREGILEIILRKGSYTLLHTTKAPSDRTVLPKPPNRRMFHFLLINWETLWNFQIVSVLNLSPFHLSHVNTDNWAKKKSSNLWTVTLEILGSVNKFFFLWFPKANLLTSVKDLANSLIPGTNSINFLPVVDNVTSLWRHTVL